ncbi:hypothetical protein O988_02688 [Pseudogymnoascus sp. VKM F-3808]|nr:hypothetical protein O988_02688 [Pseudogymnoascus sp. VKM F-3808]
MEFTPFPLPPSAPSRPFIPLRVLPLNCTLAGHLPPPHVHPFKFVDPASVPPRPDGSDVHPKLRLHEGYACRACIYRTINPLIIKRHISKEHRDGSRTSRAELNTLYDDVFLQTWTHRAHGVEQQYWVVRRNGSLTRPVAEGETYALLESTHKREWDRLESDARARAHNAQDTGRQTLVASRPWTDRARWLITYDGARRDIFLDLAAMPHAGTTDHTLGNRLGSGEAPGPRFNAFAFRAFRMPPDVRQRLVKIRFRKSGLSQLQAIWEHEAWEDGDLDWCLTPLPTGEGEGDEAEHLDDDWEDGEGEGGGEEDYEEDEDGEDGEEGEEGEQSEEDEEGMEDKASGEDDDGSSRVGEEQEQEEFRGTDREDL